MTTDRKTEWGLDLQAPEVLAILAGRQTQLRIPMQIQPNGHPTFEFRDDPEWGRVAYWPGESEFDPFDCHCPAGNVGDVAWGREEWALYQAIVERSPNFSASGEVHDGDAAYRADGHIDIEACREHLKEMIGPGCRAIEIDGDDWKPSSEMPRWASRIEFKVGAVRIERLQEISDADCKAQGIAEELVHPPSGYDPDSFHPPGAVGYVSGLQPFPSGSIHPKPQEAMADLWNELNLHDTWYANPHVWVVTFERTKPEKAEADGKTATD